MWPNAVQKTFILVAFPFTQSKTYLTKLWCIKDFDYNTSLQYTTTGGVAGLLLFHLGGKILLARNYVSKYVNEQQTLSQPPVNSLRGYNCTRRNCANENIDTFPVGDTTCDELQLNCYCMTRFFRNGTDSKN